MDRSSAPTSVALRTTPRRPEMSQRPIDVVRACLKAFADHDRDALEALVAADYTFTSPMDNALDRDAYFRICWPESKQFEAFDIVHKAEDGDHAFVTYE